MATCELKGELKYPNGQTKFAVKAENNLKSIINGVKKLNSEISQVLTSLVEQEKSLNADSRTDTYVEDDEDDDEEDPTDTVKSNAEPPAKRVKTRS